MSKPNILFVILTTEIGGVEVVTSVLANKFVAEGYGVSIFSFLKGENSIVDRLDNRVKLYCQETYSMSRENVDKLRSVLLEDRINIIINQNGMPLIPILTIKKAVKHLKIKIISIFHNQPGSNGRIQAIDTTILACNNRIRKNVLRIQRWIVGKITGFGMAYNYKRSDVFLVLSPSHIYKFKHFTGLRNPTHLQVMANPLTIESNGYIYDIHKKQKEIIYVGRLDSIQKRVCRIIDTWSLLEEKFIDWRLTIVGEGEDRNRLKEHAKRLGLRHILFEGYQNPIEYYKRASILVLTSDFEGFPLVLGESMNFGVIPVVYNSFSAAGDIVENGKNGILLPFHQDGYQPEEAASLFSVLIANETKRERMAREVIAKSREFSLEKIFEKWEILIQDLISIKSKDIR